MASELGVQTIQHTNGTDAISISSTGDVTMPNKKLYHWFARRTGTHVGVNTDIIFDTEVSDAEGIYDNTTGIVTVPVAGVYQINFTGITNGAGSTAIGLYNSSNSRYYNIGIYGEGTANDNLSFSVALPLSANDTLKIRVTGGTVFSANADGAPTFSGYLIG